MQQTCVFCRIVQREIPAKIVHEDDIAVAFEDLRKQAPVHFLIIPRKHIPTLNDLTPEDNNLVGHLFQVAKRLAEQFNIHGDGYRALFNVNAGAGQTVYHIHLHVLGGRPFIWPPG